MTRISGAETPVGLLDGPSVDDIEQPRWQYRTPTGTVILLPGDMDTIAARLSHYFTNRLGARPDILFDLDDDLNLTGRGAIVGPETRRVFLRFDMQRISERAAA